MDEEERQRTRSMRFEDPLWKAMREQTIATGESISDVTREFWRWRLRLPGAKFPRRPREIRAWRGGGGGSWGGESAEPPGS